MISEKSNEAFTVTGRGHGPLRLVLLWPLYINSWERDNMLWPRDVKLREQRHPFLVDTSLMRKQTCVTIATWDYQRWIKLFSPSHSLKPKSVN